MCARYFIGVCGWMDVQWSVCVSIRLCVLARDNEHVGLKSDVMACTSRSVWLSPANSKHYQLSWNRGVRTNTCSLLRSEALPNCVFTVHNGPREKEQERIRSAELIVNPRQNEVVFSKTSEKIGRHWGEYFVLRRKFVYMLQLLSCSLEQITNNIRDVRRKTPSFGSDHNMLNKWNILLKWRCLLLMRTEWSFAKDTSLEYTCLQFNWCNLLICRDDY